MTARMSATEKLAIDICWNGFSDPKTSGYRSGRHYWDEFVADDAKKRYREHAAELIWWVRRLGIDRLSEAVTEHDKAA